jgi:hypothetical protein
MYDIRIRHMGYRLEVWQNQDVPTIEGVQWRDVRSGTCDTLEALTAQLTAEQTTWTARGLEVIEIDGWQSNVHFERPESIIKLAYIVKNSHVNAIYAVWVEPKQ